MFRGTVDGWSLIRGRDRDNFTEVFRFRNDVSRGVGANTKGKSVTFKVGLTEETNGLDGRSIGERFCIYARIEEGYGQE